MPMTPTLWSISGLATEFQLDRRTTAARLRDVAPAGTLKGHPAWRLRDAAPFLVVRVAEPGPAKPAAVAALEELGAPFTIEADPAVEALVLGCKIAAERLPGRFAVLAAHHGLPMEQTVDLFRSTALAAVMLVDEIVAEAGAEWRSDEHHEMPYEPDWSRLAVARV